MRVTLKRRTHQISANGTDFAYISVIGADFQCVYFPQCWRVLRVDVDWRADADGSEC